MADSDSSACEPPWRPPPADPFSISPAHHHHHTSLPAPAFNVYPGQSHSLAGIAARAGCLGFTMGISLVLSLITGCFQLPFFVFILSSFHLAEFWATARYNTPNAKTKAFLLSTNGTAYTAAHMAATLEYLVEVYFFPKLKLQISAFPTMAGLLLVLIGQTTRTLAMVHAGTNFNHLVQRQHRPGHVLVTQGVYAWLRHPSYFGYYWWGLGTQLLLANPLCFITYTIVLWKFFNERIRIEERFLVGFFGNAYITYRSATPTWIPFIR